MIEIVHRISILTLTAAIWCGDTLAGDQRRPVGTPSATESAPTKKPASSTPAKKPTRTRSATSARPASKGSTNDTEDVDLNVASDEVTSEADRLFDAGRYLEAAQAYQRALRSNPKNGHALMGLGDSYLNMGRAEQAIDTFKQLVRIRPRDSEAHFSLGDAYTYLGRYGESLDPFKRAIALRSNYAEAYFGLGDAYRYLEIYEQAEANLLQAIKLKPDFADALYSLGLLYLSMGNTDGALEQHRALIPIDSYLAGKLLAEIERLR